jgi:hypothetical protein
MANIRKRPLAGMLQRRMRAFALAVPAALVLVVGIAALALLRRGSLRR